MTGISAMMTMAHLTFSQFLRNPINKIFRRIYLNGNTRKSQYARSLDLLLVHRDLFDEITLLECLSGIFPLYLEHHRDCIKAISNNTLVCRNKGIQEFSNISRHLKTTSANSEQKIFKLTGRYLLQKPDFLHACQESSSDVVAKRDSDIWGENGKGIHTFAFCAKKGVLIQFGEWLIKDDAYRSFGMDPVEWIFFGFLQKEGIPLDIIDGKMFVETCYSENDKRVVV